MSGAELAPPQNAFQEVGGQLPGHARAHTVDTSRRGSAHYSLRRVEQSQSFNTGFAGALPSFEGSTGDESADLCGRSRKRAGRPVKHDGGSDSLSEIEKRRMRRRTANRESARRVRDRRTQQSGKLESQAAQITAVNEQLLKKVAEVEGERSLAKSLLQTFHQKLEHLQLANQGLQARVAALQAGPSDCPQSLQGSLQWGFGPEGNTQEETTVDVNHGSAPAPELCNPTEWHPASMAGFGSQPACDDALGAQVYQNSQPLGTSPFASAAPVTTPAQVALPSKLSGQEFYTNSSMDVNSGIQAVPASFADAARADSMEAMLGIFSSDQSAGSMQRMSSLTLSRGLSAMLDSCLQP